MKLFRPLEISLRYKIPMRVIGLVLITAFVITTSMAFREYEASRRDLVAHSAGLGRVLADTLTTPMIHDDLWRAYEIIRSPQRHECRAIREVEQLHQHHVIQLPAFAGEPQEQVCRLRRLFCVEFEFHGKFFFNKK